MPGVGKNVVDGRWPARLPHSLAVASSWRLPIVPNLWRFAVRAGNVVGVATGGDTFFGGRWRRTFGGSLFSRWNVVGRHWRRYVFWWPLAATLLAGRWFAPERRRSPLAEIRFLGGRWRRNLWRSLFALERRRSPLAEIRFWWPLAATPFGGRCSRRNRRRVATWRRYVFWWPLAANLWRVAVSRWNVVGRHLAEIRFWWPLAANLWRLLFALETSSDAHWRRIRFLVAVGGEPLAVAVRAGTSSVADGGVARTTGGGYIGTFWRHWRRNLLAVAQQFKAELFRARAQIAVARQNARARRAAAPPIETAPVTPSRWWRTLVGHRLRRGKWKAVGATEL